MNIAVASGKGGTGKTFFSTNLFYSLRQMGYSSLLVDCDAEAPNSFIFFPVKKLSEEVVTEYRPVLDRSNCVLCGKCAEYCNYHAIFFLPAMNKVVSVVFHLGSKISPSLKLGSPQPVPEPDQVRVAITKVQPK